MDQVVAERELLAVLPNGERFPVFARIGMPRKVADGFDFEVHVRTTDEIVRTVSGVDSLQAIASAAQYACRFLPERAALCGYTLYFMPDETGNSDVGLCEFTPDIDPF